MGDNKYNWKLVNFCEFDKYASKSFCAVHDVDESLNLGDITQVDETKLDEFNMICGGSPCFPAGTMVLTKEGEKEIENIKVGDLVLTHKNRYMPVNNIGGEVDKEIYVLKAQGFLDIFATSYHPFYVRKAKDSESEKIRMEDIKKGYYIASPINTASENPCDLTDEQCFRFGKLFKGKAPFHAITKQTFLDLPTNKLEMFFEAYMCNRNGKKTFETNHKEAVSFFKDMIQKVCRVGCSVYYDDNSDVYTIDFSEENQDWFIAEDKVWYPVKSVEKTDRVENVYNIEVDEDHTYVADGAVVFNCQDFSLAGKQAGSRWTCTECGHEYNPLVVHYSERHKCPECGSENIDKSRSSLLVEWLRVIRANKPSWGIYENVKNIVGKKFKETFDMFIQELHEYGYNTYYEVLNAKNFGVPQNRERLYLIIVKKELDNGMFTFPKGFDSDVKLKDVLEDEVDEKYYVNTPKAQDLIDRLAAERKLEKQVSNTVRAGGRGSLDRHQWDLVSVGDE